MLKKMSELTDEDRMRLYPIIISEYNPEWTEWYKNEKAIIERLAGCENIVSIHHIGSTSVTELAAKPIVDILLEVRTQIDLQKLKLSFPQSEYVCLDRQTVQTDDIIIFLKGYTLEGFADRVFHIHVRYKGDWNEVRFRDYLAAHPETAAEYAALKKSLKDKYEYDRDGYTNAKGQFIKEVMALARSNK